MTDFLAFVAMSLVLVYAFWQLRNFNHWQKQTRVVSRPTPGYTPFITLIVPFRNEREHLPDLLKDLHRQDYPTDTGRSFLSMTTLRMGERLSWKTAKIKYVFCTWLMPRMR
jgi:cellulose synthase/poly-beta-1,6-N-acetylglucosamine synthase-like glycosyltransferase